MTGACCPGTGISHLDMQPPPSPTVSEACVITFVLRSRTAASQ
ncbi:hypothetical protein FM104_11950 [Microbacterium esteraromaticum]|uniref:Uncharacterized protein n=1 Tax=Microbacterium esteraromaticum TaxID=57043 RepID=A0A1R4KDR2_9MICO|nr:hypothetical protein FM104_11950 [Microbacterium esteraromaticum]